MCKYDNYIYLTICEVSLKYYENSNYSTYVEFCKGLHYTLRDGDVSKRDRRIVEGIVSMLDKVFSLTPELTGQYIGDYFNLTPIRLAEFEKSVRMTKELFPNIGN